MYDREIEYIRKELARWELAEQLFKQCDSKELVIVMQSVHRDLPAELEVCQRKPKVPKPPKVLYQTRKGKWINPVNSCKRNQRGKR